jgi:Tfp pilus assembly protein PilO
MGVELKKPYSIDDIRKHPFAVVISLLIGLLLISVGRSLYLSEKVESLMEQANEEKAARIEMYESMIFYKQETERLQNEQSQSDSLVRQRTQPFVNKILKHEK